MQTNREWAQLNFGACQLGDKRRTARLVQVATAVANNPAASFPDQMPTWSDLKAAYDLFDDDDVTFEAIAGTHGEQTKQRSGWVVRAAQLNRYVLAGAAEQRMKLSEYLPQLELRGTYELSLRARPGQ